MSWFCLRRDIRVRLWIACSAAILIGQTARASVVTDNSFNASANGTVSTIAIQPDAKIIVGGMFTSVNGVTRNYLARLNADGSLDNSFAPSSAPAQAVYRVEVAGSKIYVGAGDGIRRYDLNGTLEWHYPMQMKTFAVDSEQRVVIGGQFARVENQFHRNLARLTTSGNLDNTFSPEIGCCAGEGVFALARRGDAMLVGGQFQSVNATPAAHVASIINTGAVEPGFAASADSAVLSIVNTPDGNFLRVSERTVARHLATGANDPVFAPLQLSSADERFLTAALDADGRAVIGGNFASGGNVARVNDDGSVDSSFETHTDGAVHAVAITADGSILLGGSFTSVNGSARSGIVKVSDVANSSPAPKLNVAASGGSITLSWPAPAGAFNLESKELDATMWSPVTEAISSAAGANAVTVSAAGNGKLFRLRAND